MSFWDNTAKFVKISFFKGVLVLTYRYACIDFVLWRNSPTRIKAAHFCVLQITNNQYTSDKTPLDEWSPRRSGHYLHNTQKIQGKNIHALGRFLIHDPKKKAVSDLGKHV
jgi:hypothetical protein